MATQTIVEVDEAAFEREVIERSREVPVLVDFWASWCGPCRVLGPVLERVAEEMEGALVLAKVDIDRSPLLAEHFAIRGIPNVLLFKDGEAVDQFVGALPEEAVRQFLRPHIATEADALTAEATRRLEAGDVEEAHRLFSDALAHDPQAAGARFGLARLALLAGDLEEAERQAGEISAASDLSEKAQALRDVAERVREARVIGSREDCERRLSDDSGDLEARFALGGHALAAGRYREALEHYLELVRRDRQWRNEAGRKTMLSVFALLGVRDPVSDEFRDRLRQVLY